MPVCKVYLNWNVHEQSSPKIKQQQCDCLFHFFLFALLLPIAFFRQRLHYNISIPSERMQQQQQHFIELNRREKEYMFIKTHV